MKSRISQSNYTLPTNYIELTKVLMDPSMNINKIMSVKDSRENMWDKSRDELTNGTYPFIDLLSKDLTDAGINNEGTLMGLLAGLFMCTNICAEVYGKDNVAYKDIDDSIQDLHTVMKDIIVNNYADGDLSDVNEWFHKCGVAVNATRLCTHLFGMWYLCNEKLSVQNIMNLAHRLGYCICYLYFIARIGRKEHRYAVGTLNMEAFDLTLYIKDDLSIEFLNMARATGSYKDGDIDSKMLRMGGITTLFSREYKPESFPKMWQRFTKRQKAQFITGADGGTVKEVNDRVADLDNAFPIFKEGFTAGLYDAFNTIWMIRLGKDLTKTFQDTQRTANSTLMDYSKKLEAQVASLNDVNKNRSRQIDKLNTEIKELKRKLYTAENKPAKVEYREKSVDRIVKVEVPVDTAETSRLRNLCEKQKARIANLENIKNAKTTQEQTIIQLTQKLTDLEDYIEEIQKEEEEVVDTSQLTDNEIALLQHIKAHISMPDCAAVNKLSALIPSAKIETRPFGYHDDIQLTNGYDVYIFCTKLSHSQFASWINQVRKRGYNGSMVNTTGVVTICREIIAAYSKVVSKK